MAEKKEMRFIVGLKKMVFYKDTAALEVISKNKEHAEKEALKFARKHAEDGTIEWTREMASKAPRVTIEHTTEGDVYMNEIPEQTKSDLQDLGEDNANATSDPV